MALNKDDLNLIERYFDSDLSSDELEKFNLKLEQEPEFNNELKFRNEIRDQLRKADEYKKTRENVSAILKSKQSVFRSRWTYISLAASVILFIAIYFFINSGIFKREDQQITEQTKIDSIINNRIGLLISENYEPCPKFDYIVLRSLSYDATDSFILAADYYNLKNYDSCILILNDLINRKSFSNVDTLNEIYFYLGNSYLVKGIEGNNEELVKLSLESFNNITHDPYYAQSKWYSVLALLKLGDKVESMSLLDTLIQLKYPDNVEIFRDSLLNTLQIDNLDFSKAFDFYKMGEYEKAALEYEVMLPLIEKKYGSTDTSYYVKQLEYAALSYENIKNYKKAVQYYLLSISIYETNGATLDEDYIRSLYNLANSYLFCMSDYEKAEFYYRQILTIIKIKSGEDNLEYAKILNGLTLLYNQIGRYEEVELLYQRILDIIKKQLGNNHPYYAIVQGNLARFYLNMGHYRQAEQLFRQTLEIIKKQEGENTYYSTFLGSLAVLYKNMGRYKQAEPLFKQAIDITKTLEGKHSRIYARQINNLAVLYKVMGQYKKAEPLYIRALEIDSILFGKSSPNYARELSNLGKLYMDMGQYDKAEPLIKQALEIDSSRLGNNHPTIATHLNNIASLYQATNRYEDAEQLIIRAIEIDKMKLHENHPAYALHLNNLASLYIATERYEKVEPVYRQVFQIYQNQLKTNTGFLSEKELEKFLNTFIYNLEICQSFITDQNINQTCCGDLAYDIELSHKGLLLRSAIGMKARVLESKDTSLTNTYFDLLSLRRRINRITTSSSGDISDELAKLENETNELEKSLALKSQDYKKIQQENEVTWQDVRQNLKEDEAALEFAGFHYYNGKEITDSILYVAILLRSNDTIPQVIYLFEEAQLRNAIPPSGASPSDINQVYFSPQDLASTNTDFLLVKNKGLYDLIWQPIENLLESINTIYFAPSGLLHSVSLAAISCPGNNLLMEKYNLVHLSSTSTLALQKKPQLIHDAVIFGGIIYETDTLTLLNKVEEYKKEESSLLAYNRSYTGDNRSGFKFLLGSQKETEMISEKLENKNISAAIYTGTDAVEESFMALSGQNSPSIIHLSTHGFYFPDTVSEENRKNIMFSSKGEVRFRYSDDPLLRSGLLMSGANLAWKGSTLPDGVEDGILTAKEVANMDLMNTQLVVLSGCQTGQGDVKGNEGVEGLHRGFKMAGVKYIIMSLWPVPDNETAEFMVAFYDNWLAGKDIHKAFHDTQSTMSNKYKDEPFKWAGFVLVE